MIKKTVKLNGKTKTLRLIFWKIEFKIIVKILAIETPRKLNKIERFEGIINEPPIAIETMIELRPIKKPSWDVNEIWKTLRISKEKTYPKIASKNIILENKRIAIKIINPESIEFCNIRYPRFCRNKLISSGIKLKYVFDWSNSEFKSNNLKERLKITNR